MLALSFVTSAAAFLAPPVAPTPSPSAPLAPLRVGPPAMSAAVGRAAALQSRLLEAAAAATDASGAAAVADEHATRHDIQQLLRRRGLPVDEEDYPTLISLAGRVGMWEEAVQLLRRMEEHVYPTAVAYEAAIWACARSAEWRLACELLRDMTDRGLRTPGAFTAAASACRAAGEWQPTRELLLRARAEGVECDRFLYMQAIDACADAAMEEEAMQLYALAVQSHAIGHWLDDEPLTIDLHGFTQQTAACAVRHVLRHEIGNFMSGDLRIVTGAGRHSEDGVPLLLPRIERVLTDEFDLAYEHEWQQRCCEETNTCALQVNKGCLVVQLQELFRYLTQTKPFEMYVVNLGGA